MANLNEIVHAKIKNISQENIELARDKCRQADQCLQKTNGDTDLILEALDLYEESIKLYSKQVEPYLGLACIAYSAGDLPYALGLLNKAIEFDSNNEKVNGLHQLISEQYKKEHISGTISKAAGKSLRETIKSKKLNINMEFNFFEKLTSLILKPSKKTVLSEDSQKNSAIVSEKTLKNNATANPGNFFENIKKVTSQTNI